MSISVVDLQNEAVEEVPVVENIEEGKDVIDTFVSNEVVEDVRNEPRVLRDINEAPKEEAIEAPKEEVKQKPKRQTQKDKMNCPKCFKEMTIKSYKYSHEKNCQGQLQDRAVKPHSKPRHKVLSEQREPKQQPKPKISTQEIYEEEETQPQQVANAREALTSVKFKLIKPTPQPANTLTSLQQHYQFLQNEYMKQKQDKYNKLCSNMFSTKTKKR